MSVISERQISRWPHWSVPVLHWIMVLLIIGAFVIGQVMEDFPRSERGAIMGYHALLGLSVLVLFLPRIWAILRQSPVAVGDDPRIVKMMARIAHGLLYLVMIAMPVTGLLAVMTSGRSFSVAGLFSLPDLGRIEWLHEGGEEIHEFFVPVLVSLVVLHVIAAIWHHFIRHDEVLARYVPWLRK
ncbi:cytochrome b [Thalassospira sp. A3_1]|uniref:cytochrome b n=1 Tax=Thalassospira sp. A3_1 TaxID=2821088 RepID=UPI001ADC9D6B|nr:cytochrome b [Thalassospira sp. A3_1]MBO9509702.1 cytochrome b [Thalassospira sp. A3_1]